MCVMTSKSLFIYALLFASLSTLSIALLDNEGPGERVELEGLYMDLNFRDLGQSLNECLEERGIEQVFKENILLRSNKWFSGWSCDKVDRPDTIISFNYEPDRKRKYFCKKRDGTRLVAEFARSDIEILDIEFLKTWGNLAQRKAICKNLESVLSEVGENRKTLFHCEAGRDRTGAIAAILAALVMEKKFHLLDKIHLEAAECDYRKSRSLVKEKHGRVAELIQNMTLHSGSVYHYLENKCGFNPSILNQFINRVIFL